MPDFKPLIREFNQGYWAFKNGKLTCPYPHWTIKGKEWQRGFDRAYFDNLEAVT